MTTRDTAGPDAPTVVYHDNCFEKLPVGSHGDRDADGVEHRYSREALDAVGAVRERAEFFAGAAAEAVTRHTDLAAPLSRLLRLIADLDVDPNKDGPLEEFQYEAFRICSVYFAPREPGDR